jgi:LysR family hydrogen peroxide-inducible transcriptional activator
MTLRELRYLVAIIEHRHFGRAAEACCVTQPTLSAQLRKLESYLGVVLIDRSGKQPMPTSLGEQIARRARKLLEQADEILQLTRQRRGPLEGAFSIGVIPTLAPYYLPWLLPHLARLHSRLHLVVVEDTTRRLEEQLDGHLIDAALLALPAFHRSDMVEHPLFDEPSRAGFTISGRPSSSTVFFRSGAP